MSNKSSIREKIGENSYKRYNDKYPLIEGYLFQKLDNIISLASLSPDMSYRIFNRDYMRDSILKISYHNNINLNISFDDYQKRMIVSIDVKGSSSHKTRLLRQHIFSEMQEKFNLTQSSRHSWYGDYNFKYNYKNCQRIVNITEYLISITK